MTPQKSLGLLVLSLQLACSSAATSPDPSPESPIADEIAQSRSIGAALVGTPPDNVQLAQGKSFVVVDQPSLAAVAKAFPMGKLLYDVNQYLTAITPQWNIDHPTDPRKVHDDLDWATHPFHGGSTDTVDNNNAPHPVGTVIPSVDSFGERVVPYFAPDVDPVGPFRLLAVVNRLDLAGDFDMRGGGELGGAERRWFGEGRLIFGLSSPLDPKTPFPMTFIMEYRLPALTTNKSGTIVVDTAFDFAVGPTSMADWIQRRKLWAQVWANLSTYDLGSSAYQSALRTVVAAFAIGKNHLALRSGERVRSQANGAVTDEFEYREFYLNGQWMLSTRKLRREPMGCAEKSATLTSRIDSEWNGAPTFAWNYMLGDRNMTDAEISEVTAACGGSLPYGQQDEDPGVQFRAKFSRFKTSDVWNVATTEDKRHAFAAGTCSGCHGGETGTSRGFHVVPSLPGKNATLSTFLSGKSTATPNGVEYPSNEPGRRIALLKAFGNGTDVAGDMLHDLTCNDVDTCPIQ